MFDSPPDVGAVERLGSLSPNGASTRLTDVSSGLSLLLSKPLTCVNASCEPPARFARKRRSGHEPDERQPSGEQA